MNIKKSKQMHNIYYINYYYVNSNAIDSRTNIFGLLIYNVYGSNAVKLTLHEAH